MGDYMASDAGVVTNSLIPGPDARPPLVSYSDADENGCITITYSEFVQNIYAPTDAGFHTLQFPLNPGLREISPVGARDFWVA